jgi:hypothetical protein
MKSVAILLVSLVVIGLILWYCLLPPRRMPGYVLGDDKCDLCGRPAVYRVWIQDRYLAGEYCRIHRWIGFINADPMSKVMNVFLGAAVFGAIYAVLSLLAGKKQQGQDVGI